MTPIRFHARLSLSVKQKTYMDKIQDQVVSPLVVLSVAVEHLAYNGLRGLINSDKVDPIYAKRVLELWIETQEELNKIANAARRISEANKTS